MHHSRAGILHSLRTEGDIVNLFRWCENESLAAVPYGGGTSVVGGVNPPGHDRYRGTVSIDMKYFDKVLGIDLSAICHSITLPSTAT